MNKMNIRAFYKSIGVNISERKSGTERTKKLELVFFSIARGRNWYCSASSRVADKTYTILQTDTWHDQMVILYYETHVQNH